MLYTKHIPELAQIPADIKILNQFDETTLVGKEFCIIVAELTPEQLELVKKHDKCPVRFTDTDTNFSYALSLAVIGFIQEHEALSQSGLTNTWGMPLIEIDSRLMCSSYIDHINTYRKDAKIGDTTADTLIAQRLNILGIELNALKHDINHTQENP